MDGLNVRKIEIIVKDLLSEFDKESGKLQAEYDDNAVRIIEIEENIHNYKENEDIDFQVFSPRKIDNQNEEKIEAMRREKESIEEINKSLYRQIKYYTDKKDKLNEILEVIEEDRDMPISIDKEEKQEDDIISVDKKILEYYDSIANDNEDDVYPEEPENIGNEIKSGWRIITEELDSPIDSIIRESNSTEDIIDNLNNIKQEINIVLSGINSVMDMIKK